MKIKRLRTDKGLKLSNNTSLDIQYYGEDNDFPQKILNILSASVTGGSCVNTFAKFINGRGFKEKNNLYKYEVNRKRQTLDHILKKICQDYAQFYGFALHLNYNANLKVCEIQHIPFEQVRFRALDDEYCFDQVAIHWDWARENYRLRRFQKEDIVFVDLFNPDKEFLKERIKEAGGIEEYKGQVYYFTNTGEITYPEPIFMSALTDMNTEEGLSNIDNRNVRNRFMAGGILVDIRNDNENTDNEQEETETEEALREFQGDENTQKIIYTKVRDKEEVPVFLPFTTNNYDSEYSVTKNSVKDRIGRVFSQPPILRAEDIGAGFGADLMVNAYTFYNSITEVERLDSERAMTEIFQYWWKIAPSNDFSILPLEWKMTNTNV